MKILFFTIVLDGMPFLPLIYSELRRLPPDIEWLWVVPEGVALPQHCTQWVSETPGRLSRDGTNQYLHSLSNYDHRVVHVANSTWYGKIEMVNWPLRVAPRISKHPSGHQKHALFKDEDSFLLWQIDSDEFWSAQQIVQTREMFLKNPERNAAFFWCRYFVGPNKVITTRNCFGNHPEYEWHRVWKIKPGALFKTHEPPIIDGLQLNAFTHAETEANGLIFDHRSWCTRAQVKMKARYYAGKNNPNAKHYADLVERWFQFQCEEQWPRPLKEMMPWVEESCMVDKL